MKFALYKITSVGRFKIYLSLLSSIVILVVVFLLIHPVVDEYWGFYYRVSEFTELRNYYTICGTIISGLIGVSGVILGCFYYFHKIESDSNNNILERRRGRVKNIIELIDCYDDCVEEIVNKRFETDIRLKYLRCKLFRINDSIVSILDNNDTILKLTSDELSAILRVNSFVEQSRIIMNYGGTYLMTLDISEEREHYFELISDARKVCYLKTE